MTPENPYQRTAGEAGGSLCEAMDSYPRDPDFGAPPPSWEDPDDAWPVPPGRRPVPPPPDGRGPARRAPRRPPPPLPAGRTPPGPPGFPGAWPPQAQRPLAPDVGLPRLPRPAPSDSVPPRPAPGVAQPPPWATGARRPGLRVSGWAAAVRPAAAAGAATVPAPGAAVPLPAEQPRPGADHRAAHRGAVVVRRLPDADAAAARPGAPLERDRRRRPAPQPARGGAAQLPRGAAVPGGGRASPRRRAELADGSGARSRPATCPRRDPGRGFGGVAVAQRLERLLPRVPSMDVTIVSQSNAL